MIAGEAREGLSVWLLRIAVVLVCVVAGHAGAEERVIGGPCEGCGNVFVGMPENLASQARIAPPDELGEPLILEGTVRALDGKPAPDIIVYAYHTDAGGIYPSADTRHGRLRGWARTDDAGHYRFDTVRPGAYPGRTVPQHVHMHIIEPGRVTYYIANVHFDDDLLLTASERRRAETGRGGSGVAHPTKDSAGVWHARRDIILGRNVPDYPCPRKWTFPVPFHQSVSWSPDGSRLAFSAITTSWDDGYRIFIAQVGGSGVRQIETGGDADLYPMWSPDGTRIAFASKRDGNSDIFVMQADGTQVVRLTTHEANDSYPTWSPDGTRLAFHSQRDGNAEIYVMKADGSGQTRITDHPADDYNPAWSPDGSRIAFDSGRDDVPGDEIYIIALDGTGLARVVDKRILYASQGLYVVGTDGSGRTQLLDHVVSAAWSPDGRTIAAAAIEYDEACQDHHVLVTLPSAGGTPRRIVPE
jgi:protocatechuate 3,4-dioxygenase beta subunit